MPTYEYACKKCGEHLEVVQSFKDDALTDCPACGAAGQLRKVFGNIGITFKGSGFYKNDSRSAGGAKSEPAKAESGGSGAGGSAGESSSSSSSSSKSDTSSASKSDSSSSGSSSKGSSTTSKAAAAS